MKNVHELKDSLEPVLNSVPDLTVERYQVEEGLDDFRVTAADGTVFELRTVTTSPSR